VWAVAEGGEGQGADGAEAFVDGVGALAGESGGPGFEGLVGGAGVEDGGGALEDGGDGLFVTALAAAVFGFEAAAGVGLEDLAVVGDGDEAEFVLVEEEGGDGAVVDLLAIAGLEAAAVFGGEDGDGAEAGADGEPEAIRRWRRWSGALRRFRCVGLRRRRCDRG
jgi:hypothetical protein